MSLPKEDPLMKEGHNFEDKFVTHLIHVPSCKEDLKIFANGSNSSAPLNDNENFRAMNTPVQTQSSPVKSAAMPVTSPDETLETSAVTSQDLQAHETRLPRPVPELQRFNTSSTTRASSNVCSPKAVPSGRSARPSRKEKQPSRLMKELAAFNEEPKHKVAMTEENLEISGVWDTRYSRRVMNHKDQSRLPSPPKNLNVNQIIKDQILPRNKIKDHNAFGGAGVPVTHALDDSDGSGKDAAELYKSSESLFEGSGDSVDHDAEGDSTYSTYKAVSTSKRQRASKKLTAGSKRKRVASRQQLSREHEEATKQVEVLYEQWTEKKGKTSLHNDDINRLMW